MKTALSPVALAAFLLLGSASGHAGHVHDAGTARPTAAPGTPSPLPPFNPFDAYREDVDRILRASLSEGRAYELLGELCEVAPHRLSGSEGAARAVEWTHARMLEAGFENVRLEPCKVPHWSRLGSRGLPERLVAHVDDTEGLELDVLALGGSIGTGPDGLTAGVIEVRDFEELRARAEEAAGKIVFFNRPMDPTRFSTFDAYGGAVNQRSRGAIEAARVGGVAAVVRSMASRIDPYPHTGAMRYEDGVERVPAVAVSTAGAELLAALLEREPATRLTLTLGCEWYEDADSFNVVGELTGSELPEQVVVVGGHLDAWDVGQGAHDDGGGCMQAFEVVRLLKALDLRPRRTIRVVLFMNEENGLRGGNAYRRTHDGAMEDHVMALESDRGVFTPRGFTSDANPAALDILRDAVGLMSDARITVMEPGYGGVDISPMARHGVPLVGFLPDCQRYFDVHHSANDTFDQVHEREIELGAGAMAALCYVIADMEGTLPRNPVPETDD